MISLKDADFEMEQVKHLPFFDLKLPAIINEGKANERIEFKIVGYAMPFEACINEVIAYKLHKIDKTYTLQEYFEANIQELDKIIQLVKFSLPDKKIVKDDDDS